MDWALVRLISLCILLTFKESPASIPEFFNWWNWIWSTDWWPFWIEFRTLLNWYECWLSSSLLLFIYSTISWTWGFSISFCQSSRILSSLRFKDSSLRYYVVSLGLLVSREFLRKLRRLSIMTSDYWPLGLLGYPELTESFSFWLALPNKLIFSRIEICWAEILLVKDGNWGVLLADGMLLANKASSKV